MRLLAVELNRFRSRRAIVLLALAALLTAVVLAGMTAWNTRPLTQEDRADAAAQADLEGQRSEIRREVAACRAAPQDYLGPSAQPADCADALVPGPEAYYPREPLDLRRAMSPRGGGLGLPLGLIVAGLMVIAGCTFAGADWSSGSMTNQLLFEPRRGRVWLTKAAAVTLGSGLVALVALAGFWLALGLVAAARDVAVPGAQVERIAWHVLRAVALAMGAALGGFALTMVFRHTVAALALLFVYSIGGEIVVNLLPVEGAQRWSLGTNSLGWLAVRFRYVDSTVSCVPGERCTSTQTLTHLEAGTFLGVLLLLASVVSLLWFRRHDV